MKQILTIILIVFLVGISFNQIQYDKETIPELNTVMKQGNYRNIGELRAEYSYSLMNTEYPDNLETGMLNSMNFEYVKEFYF
ncbi:MAG: hypothetical protein PHE43_04100 [Candidatus Nanoarchaeia archaeon]|nr:hypothetical protein [Candidatus Nanoarchaeia archaeon]